jgi:hypothetical protein
MAGVPINQHEMFLYNFTLQPPTTITCAPPAMQRPLGAGRRNRAGAGTRERVATGRGGRALPVIDLRPIARSCSIFGSFSEAKAQEIVVARGHILELLRPEGDTGKVGGVGAADVCWRRSPRAIGRRSPRSSLGSALA